ncbi:hypothetical protein D5R40_21020 [Okeania hirsuta]|uniref:Uncharacterized protein n=1 Tax=Okeania hirsuta TaxID=1458930 RepID=A0A3N6QRT4_9CYAN|nr:hypothetical protein D4Z78_15230 [Okeania hirsuta]RQH34445.1 hypothetical protein D5R40_21020 [Okeania hirsuta]
METSILILTGRKKEEYGKKVRVISVLSYQLSVPLQSGGLTSGIFSFFIPLKGEAHTHNLSVKHPQLIEETQIHNGMLILPFCLNFIGCF